MESISDTACIHNQLNLLIFTRTVVSLDIDCSSYYLAAPIRQAQFIKFPPRDRSCRITRFFVTLTRSKLIISILPRIKMRPVWKPNRPTHGLKPTGGLRALHGARMHRDAGLSMHLLTGPVSVRSSSRHDRSATVEWAVSTDRASGRQPAVAGPLIDAVRCLLPVCRASTGRHPFPGAVSRRSPHHGYGLPLARRRGRLAAHPILTPPARPWCNLRWVAMPFCWSSPESIKWVAFVRLT